MLILHKNDFSKNECTHFQYKFTSKTNLWYHAYMRECFRALNK